MLNSVLKVFESRKIAALLFVGFASGLPYFLSSQTLQAWMTTEGVDLTVIGLFSLVGIPYSFKFLWSPLLDRFVPPFLGRRRGWLMVTQVLLMLAIAAMSLQNPTKALQLVAVNALLIAFLSASQDIAADAYRTDVLEEREMGAGVAVFVLGYRIALLTTGSLALILADHLPWSTVYLLLAGLMGLGLLATLFAPEPTADLKAPTSLVEAVVEPFHDFFQRKGVRTGLMILVFIVLYKFGDAIANNMSTPFLLKTGFTKTDIGAIKGGMGLLATIVGTLAGGGLLTKLGINKSLWIFGGFQAVSNLSYLALAMLGQNYPFMVLTINIENFCAGLGTAAFLAFFMSLCNKEFSATQYALLSSLYATSQSILVAPAGAIATQTGWTLFFFLSFIASFPGLALLPIFAPWQEFPKAMGRPGLDDGEDLDQDEY
jgi:PAT family beta-lactamase induction signal transducer AmpG